MSGHARAILWAQFRVMRNLYASAQMGGAIIGGISAILWYGACAAGAILVAWLLSGQLSRPTMEKGLPFVLLVAFFLWQLFPLLMASAGAQLDLKRLMVYPVPTGQMFLLEVMLRVSTGLEMLMLTAGAATGLWLNPGVPVICPLALAVYAVFNLLFAAGLKQVLARLFSRKHMREMAMVLFVAIVALPQLLTFTGVPDSVTGFLRGIPVAIRALPWGAAGEIAAGRSTLSGWGILALWTAMAFVFARRQFARSLRFDEDAGPAAAPPAAIAETAPVRSWSDRFYRIPALLFSDPLAALIEKELRFLSRAPRFRLILLLACTLGPVVWLPLAFGKQSASNTVFASNYLTFTSVYALLVLGDNLFWNAFGFDRSAAQTFFVTPVRFSSVLIAKNIVATFFVFVVMAAGTVFCLLLRLPVGGEKMLEAYAVTCVYAILVLAVGNLSSVYHPRAVDPGQAWKNTAGRVQVFLLLLYPILGVPLMLAYGARYAFDSQAAFYGVLAIDFAIGLVVYWIALESCLEAVAKDREKMVSALSQSEGPIAVS